MDPRPDHDARVPLRTFCLCTLGCKVNQYESEQIAALLRGRGLLRVEDPAAADLRIVNTCSVTLQAASKSRQTVRQVTRLPVLQPHSPVPPNQRVIVVGCWATSDPSQASALPGVSAVLSHHQNLAEELHRLLSLWHSPSPIHHPTSLPLLNARQYAHQRAFLKIQDGCDAHCSYCIIPRLRSRLWSKPVADTVAEARRLVNAGHLELVLTGIFLGAYGQPTALRRRQPQGAGKPLADLIDALCAQVPNLLRLRLSSLEPGDLTADLLAVLRSHPQIVPHFHLPLQSGSDHLLRRMNRQYTRDDFLRLADQVHAAFDRPALTTDIIVGFPGESDPLFQETLDVVDRVGFLHIHAFPFSPRPGTAAARWKEDFIHGPVVNHRIDTLHQHADAYSHTFRQQFLGATVQLLVERPSPHDPPTLHHGRCERYFPVHFESSPIFPGVPVQVRITHVTPHQTLGTLIANLKSEI